MALRPLILLALLLGPACVPEGVHGRMPSGEWVLDIAASVEATAPLWRVEMKERIDDEIAGLVKQSPYAVDRRLTESDELDREMPAIVEREIRDHVVTLTFDGGSYTLHTEVPGYAETDVTGNWVLDDDGALYLVRRNVDGVVQKQPTKVTGRLDDQGRLALPLGRLFRYVLVPGR